MAKHVVAAVDELPPGTRKRFTVEGREIVIFNLDGTFFGLLNRCPHQGGDLCDGVVTGYLAAADPGEYDYSRPGEFIRCPWHGWHFDIRTGKSWGEPDRVFTKSYPVEVQEGGRLIEGPYQAETIPVSVEESYLVVEA